MQAIRTCYKGILFRSKLEAQWAKFFDCMRLPWMYEPEGYQFSDGTRYLPDFYLPDSNQWFEVKGVINPTDEHKIKMLCMESGKDVIVGLPDGEFYMYDTQLDGGALNVYSKTETYINQCLSCGKYSFMNSVGSFRCQVCGAYDGDGLIDWIMCGKKGSIYMDYNTETWRKLATIDVRFNK